MEKGDDRECHAQGDRAQQAEVAGGRPEQEERTGGQERTAQHRAPIPGDHRQEQERKSLEVHEAGMALSLLDVPGKDRVDEPCPSRHEGMSAEVADEEVHRGPRERQAREDDEVVGGDLPDHLGCEHGREEHIGPLDVQGIRKLPAKRRAGEIEVGRPDDAVALVLCEQPEQSDSSRRVSGQTEDPPVQIGRERPREVQSQSGEAEEHDCSLDGDSRRRLRSPLRGGDRLRRHCLSRVIEWCPAPGRPRRTSSSTQP
jgi:hypothetical protein